MAALTIELTPEMERRLTMAAQERGQPTADCARQLLEEKLTDLTSAPRPSGPIDPSDPWSGLPRRAPEELDALATRQGAPLAVRFEDLLSDFWPADETCDEFIAALREWRDEGRASCRARTSRK